MKTLHRASLVLPCVLVGTAIGLAASPEAVPGKGPTEFMDIRDFGAVGDGKTSCTAAIQKAIDRCAARGGGTVRLPAGVWLTGTVYLESNLTLVLDKGCTLLGSRKHEDYGRPRASSGSGASPGSVPLSRRPGRLRAGERDDPRGGHDRRPGGRLPRQVQDAAQEPLLSELPQCDDRGRPAAQRRELDAALSPLQWPCDPQDRRVQPRVLQQRRPERGQLPQRAHRGLPGRLGRRRDCAQEPFVAIPVAAWSSATAPSAATATPSSWAPSRAEGSRKSR